jgi:hypothetical protein
MRTPILLIISFLVIPLFGQKKVKTIIKMKHGIEIGREEFNITGDLIFKKETPTYYRRDIKDSLNKFNTKIIAYIYDSNNHVETEISANTVTGYYIQKYHYNGFDKVDTIYSTDDGYYSKKSKLKSFFLFSINNFEEMISNSQTQKRLDDKTYRVSSIMKYDSNRLIGEISPDLTTTYFYKDNIVKKRFKREKSCIENILEYDKNGNLFRSYRVDSSSHYAIIRKDTSEVIVNKYNQDNLLVETFYKKQTFPSENTHYKIFYSYIPTKKIKSEKTINIQGVTIRQKKYKYRNELLLKETDNSKKYLNGVYSPKKEVTKYYYDYFNQD